MRVVGANPTLLSRARARSPGAALARIETQSALGGLLRRFADFQGPVQPPSWKTSVVLRGPTVLPLRVAQEASARIVEDHAEGLPAAGEDPAHAVAERHAMVSSGSRNRSVTNREEHRVALAQRHHLGA